MNIILSFLRFVVLVVTDLSMLPALDVMRRNRRHFELFIGVFQMFISIMFNVTEALGMSLFLTELDWHFISDILSITYFLMLCVHVMGIPDENTNHVLRYFAFACAWLMKARDGWDSTLYEAALVIAYIIGAIYRNVVPSPTKPPLKMGHVKKSGILLAVAAVSLIIAEMDIMGELLHDTLAIPFGAMHVAAGLAVYHGWLAVPCRDTKKTDDLIPTFRSTFT